MALEIRFCSSRRSSRRSDSTGSEQGTKVSSNPLARAIGANSISSERIRSPILKLVIDGRHGAGVEPRDIQERPEDFLDRLERIVDVFDQPRILAAALALDQTRHIEPRRIQRLQDVVACRRQKPRLRDVGVLGGAFGERQFRIQAGQLLGAVTHALFQRGIGAFQRFGGLEARA